MDATAFTHHIISTRADPHANAHLSGYAIHLAAIADMIRLAALFGVHNDGVVTRLQLRMKP